jgi:hypothetical protein
MHTLQVNITKVHKIQLKLYFFLFDYSKNDLLHFFMSMG